MRPHLAIAAAGLEHLANGDLTFRLVDPFSGQYDRLRGDFNTAMDRLQKALSSINTTVAAMRGGASDDLAHRTERQAATLEETAAMAIGKISRSSPSGKAHQWPARLRCSGNLRALNRAN